jgi:acyl transferase domain-containing protein/NAD(P)-dependent dehydrogenase (short-subunit alcohol dehydrogenase family)
MFKDDQMTQGHDVARPAIAIVGVSALFPGSVDSTGFWSDILAGTDRLTDVPASHWLIDDHYDADMTVVDKTYGRRGGFLDSVDLDAMGFGIPPSMVPSTDTAQLLALIVAQRVLDDATRGQFSELDRSRASVILGVTSGQELLGAMASRMNRPMWLQGMRRAGVPEDVALAACDKISDLHPQWTEATFPGLLGNVVAGRIANRLDLGGTNCVTDAACASSFSAMSMGINELYLGDSDLVIAGGVDTMNDIFMYMCFSKTPALSPTEDIRPFSDQADGTMLGEGIGMVALKRLADAERDGNDIYCVVDGVGSSSDGRSKSVYAPVSAGQARAISDAYRKADFGPDSVELIEAHGTGTVAGDAAEFGGLELAFDAAGREDRQWCALGSVKSQIGHTKAAAGAAGLFKVVMALHHKVLPQTAKIDQPNPKLDLEQSPFHLNTKSRPWVRGSDHPRRGSVSSFGFGGSNFHVALSEYTGDIPAPRLRTSDAELVVLCGSDADDLVDQIRGHHDAASEPTYLCWLAQSSQESYEPKAGVRLAVVAQDEADLRSKLNDAAERIAANRDAPFSTPTGIHYGVDRTGGDIAFLFPGQGSQYIDMVADLAMQYSEAMAPWDLAADLDWNDEPLHDVVFPKPSFGDGAAAGHDALLTATQWAQPAIGAASLSMLRLLRSAKVTPSHVGGHSFGEITALCAAGVFGESDMLRIARRRGELMAEAAQTPGSMTAVARTVDEVRDLVEGFGVDVVIANHNSHNQVVLSGETAAIEQIESVLSEAGITAKRLPVATAFHSPVVAGASGAFGDYLQDIDFEAPTIPVYANETAGSYPTTAPEMQAQLGQQLARSVRFVEMVEAMYEAGARTFVEVGPSSILTGLVGKILSDRAHQAIALDKKNKSGVAAFLCGLGQLAAGGADMNFSALWDEYGTVANPHEVPQPKLAIAINGANVGAPYPPADLAELVGPNPDSSVTHTAIPASTPATTSALPPATTSDANHTMTSEQPQPVQQPPNAPVIYQTPAAPAAGIFHAFQAVQQQTADAHSAYLNSMAMAHSSFLATSQQALAVLGQLGGGPQAAVPVLVAAPAPISAIAPPMPVAPLPLPVQASPAPLPTMTQPAPPIALNGAAPSSNGAVSNGAVSNGAVSGHVSVEQLTELLLAVVSDKTGYPSDMLTMEMELEGDLGIDSIKRVEILSAMQDEVPALPEVDTGVMAELVTLGQIVEYMSGEMDGSAATESPPSLSLHAPSASTAGLGRYTLQAVLAPSPGLPMPGFDVGKVVVVDGGSGIGPALVTSLIGASIEAELSENVHGHRVIHLGGLGDFESVDEAVAVNRELFGAARVVAQNAAADRLPGGFFVCVSDLGGAFGTDGSDETRVWSSGLTGLTRTASIELPATQIKAIDIERGGRVAEDIANVIAEELLTGGSEREIGLKADGTRLEPKSAKVDVEAGSLELGIADVVVVSGGGRGVTAATVVELARESAASFALLGRSQLEDELEICKDAPDDASLKRVLLDDARARGLQMTPAELGGQVSRILASREIRETLARIESIRGSRALYLPVDITDEAALDGVFETIRKELGPITGVIHGAGVIADKLIAEKTDEQFNAVFDTKVEGLRALLRVTAGDELKVLCLFSSVAARTGNTGQVDYAMANEVLNKVAVTEQIRRGPQCVVKSLGWGPWAGGMVTPALKTHFEAMGVTLIPLDVGARMMVDELSSPRTGQVEVVLGGGVLSETSAHDSRSSTPVDA